MSGVCHSTTGGVKGQVFLFLTSYCHCDVIDIVLSLSDSIKLCSVFFFHMHRSDMDWIGMLKLMVAMVMTHILDPCLFLVHKHSFDYDSLKSGTICLEKSLNAIQRNICQQNRTLCSL